MSVHRSDEPDGLVGDLCEVLASPLADPLAPEIVSVPTRGIERWITERIALTFGERGPGDGICANIEFPFPRRLTSDLLSTDPAARASIEAWARARVVRQIDHLIRGHAGEDWMWVITRFIRGLDDGASAGVQRLRAASRIERLFSGYARYRPELLEAWTAGSDVASNGDPIDASAVWQPTLWRHLRAAIGTPPLHEVLPAALASLRTGAAVDLPERISVYGITAIDPVDLSVLDAVSGYADVHLFVLHPSPTLWSAIAGSTSAPTGRQPRRSDDASIRFAVHPMLRSWAQDSRELQLMLSMVASDDAPAERDPGPKPTSLLKQVQSDVRQNLEPVASQEHTKAVEHGEDRSIQIHSCHGPRRQVEVLRDAILHVMSDDPTIEARDIVIMTPDLETFGPLIETAFPSSAASGGALPDLRVRIADRAPARTNPLIRLLATIVRLTESRMSASDVKALVAIPELRRRFRIDDEIANEIAGLIDDANVKWGIDTDHRARWSAGNRDEHTWRRGIDRVLTGVFYEDSTTLVVDDVGPLPGVEGSAALAAGKLAALVTSVRTVAEMLSEPADGVEWPGRLETSVRMLASTDRSSDWQWSQLARLLDETFASPDGLGAGSEIGIGEVAMLISPWTEARPSRLHHRTGDLTVCTLPPMRSVPYRVVCLLSLDHDRFPRKNLLDGDDLLVDDERIGDRDRGAEDRQLLLDAVMAARDYLIITYSGRDPHTNAENPPAVPVSELREIIEGMVGTSATRRVVTDHPLQPFSGAVFTDGALGVEGAWGFDRMHYDGAKALAERRVGDANASEVVAVESVEDPNLDDLIGFLKAPSATFLDRNVGIRAPRPDDPPDDELPLALNGLENWGVKVRLLEGIRDGVPADILMSHERAADTVPAGSLSDAILDAALDDAQRLSDVAAEFGCENPESGRITGVVEGIEWAIEGAITTDVANAVVCDVTPSGDKATRRLALYAKVIWLSAIDPEHPWRGVVVGKGRTKGSVLDVEIGPIGRAPQGRRVAAIAQLDNLVGVYREGLTHTVPIFPECALKWQATDPAKRRGPVADKWEGSSFNGIPGERDDAAVMTLFPDLETFDDLCASEFPAYAARIWEPILAITREHSR